MGWTSFTDVWMFIFDKQNSPRVRDTCPATSSVSLAQRRCQIDNGLGTFAMSKSAFPIDEEYAIEDSLDQAEAVLGHEFENREFLELALTHASCADQRLYSNERLEFLGDAVLCYVVCEYLYEIYPESQEGELTKLKSAIVSRETCADVAEELGLHRLIRLGKGMSNRHDVPRSLSAGVFESVVGALLMDGGIDVAKAFLRKHLKKRTAMAARSGHQHNFKSALQQIAQQNLTQTPQYIMLDEKGPDHAKCFEVCVEIGSTRYESSWGRSKKRAEQEAALNALKALGFASVDEETGEIIVNQHINA